MIRKITALVLVLSILLTTACSEKPFSVYDTPKKFNDPFLSETKDMDFSDLRITNIDENDTISSINRMKELSQKENSLEELKALYKKNYSDINLIETNYTISMLRYDIDTQNSSLSEANLKYEQIYNNVSTLYEEALKTVLSSRYGEEMKKYIGDDVANSVDTREIDIEQLNDLANREAQLTNEYMKLIATPTTVTVDGEHWDENKLYEHMDELDEDKYLEIYLEIDKAVNEKAVKIYISLIETRKKLAKLFGYDNPGEFYYKEVFHRDYSPEEAQLFHKNVKEHIAPIYNSVPTIVHDAVIETKDVLPTISEILPLISPEVSEIFNKMVEKDLCILTDDMAKSYDGGYTTFISTYRHPVIYNATYGNYRSITDTVHEFGHYCDYYLNCTDSPCHSESNFDIAEVPSMGLEVLFYDYYDRMFENCNDEKAHFLRFFLGSVVDGCYMDEAQQKIYNYEGELTADVVNDIFARTAEEYGMTDDFKRYTWVYVTHNFLSPFYYISYASSSIASLEIWMTAQTESKEKAVETYLRILSYGSFEYGYNESIRMNGLKGFTDYDTLKKIGESVKNEIDKLMTAQ